MPVQTPTPPPSMYRSQEHPTRWEGRGTVVAVGIGHAPTARRWDGKPETSVGAMSILALRKAIEDAGVRPDMVDGLVIVHATSTGADWPKGNPVPMDVVNAFNPTDAPLDGIAQLSAEWILKNTPELKNVRFIMHAPTCMTNALVVAAQAVASGLTHTCLVLKGWHNLPGRYYQVNQNLENTISGPAKWRNPWGPPASYGIAAMPFEAYCRKYGKTHEMMAPFIVNSKKNGLLFPEGFFSQHRWEPVTEDDYNSARWIAKPANLLDNDLPISTAAAYLFTTAERAKDMKQKPVYILNHASDRTQVRGLFPTLEEIEESAYHNGLKLYEGAGITADDLSFENLYDGFSLFHVFHLEGLRYAGVKPGEALDFFQTDISINSWRPVSPSGGNIGSGRSRFWMSTDCMQQIQGRAGARQMKRKAEIGVSGGPFITGGNYIMWGAHPD